MAQFVVAFVVVVATLVGAVSSVGGQDGSGADAGVGVRIVARRQDPGRVEFALQQRGGGDAGWGERLLPTRRFFPAQTAVGRWLVSTPLTLVVAARGGDAAGADVRIVARRVAGGRVEFGLQQRGAAGEWGERLLPTRRFFPLQTALGRWLVSAPLTLTSGETPPPAGLPPSIDGIPTTTTIPTHTATTTVPAPTATTTVPAPTTTTTSLPPGGTADAPQPVEALTAEAAEEVMAELEAYMAGLVNELRRSVGAAPLTYDAGIAAVARRWSRTMGAEVDLYHNPMFAQEVPSGWRSVAENVSAVPGPMTLLEALHRSFDGLADSPGHYGNMTNPDFTHFGIGIAVDNGTLWVTQNFGHYPDGPGS